MSKPTDGELSFVDQMGRFYSRQYGLPPVTGRVWGWLLICDPPAQTAAEIAEALSMSRSAVGTAIGSLEKFDAIQRRHSPGERADRVIVAAAAGSQAIDAPAEYGALAAMARHGLKLMDDAPLARQGRLLELAAFCDFLLEKLPALAAEWRVHRAAMLASGELPADWSE